MSRFYNKNTPFERFIFLTLAAVMVLSLAGCGHKNSDPSADPAAADSASPTVDPNAYSGPDVQEKTAVGDDYFSDAAFMGNSLMEGFKMFSGLTSCDYYAATSMTVVGASSKPVVTLANGSMGTLVQGLCQKPYGKIYILLGINEIGSDVGTFGNDYAAMLDTIIAAQPDCKIYVMGLTPVSAAKSAGSDVFNMDRVKLYNNKLREIAGQKQCYYIDLVSALAGEDGYLPSNETPDGVHFSANTYAKWLNYLKTHYV